MTNLKKLKADITEKDKWNSSEGENNGTPFLLRFRPHLQKFVEAKIFNKRVIVHWNYSPNDATLLPNENDFELMGAFENSTVPILERDLKAILAFVYTGQGRKEWHFYSKDIEDTKKIIQGKLQVSNLQSIEINIEDDPFWNEYKSVLEDTDN